MRQWLGSNTAAVTAKMEHIRNTNALCNCHVGICAPWRRIGIPHCCCASHHCRTKQKESCICIFLVHDFVVTSTAAPIGTHSISLMKDGLIGSWYLMSSWPWIVSVTNIGTIVMRKLPWQWGASTRYYTSHTKTMLPTRKSVPRSSKQLDHTKTWPS